MKKSAYTLTLLLCLSLVFVGCREEKETPAETIEETIEEVGEEVEAASEDVQDVIEDVEEVEE
ncbi:hypothetical protein [Lacinutrix sp.]|uniref:hypothetical protein n=1 Tax=Lacinutrix sp. TaxID=1937692 RepID=UPI002630EC3D|nr:hypothetical protein [Lacinutrix sp.]MDG1715536.1 hypothetical protein [Lacinutrix sp.]